MVNYKTLNSNISATTQYGEFVWGNVWGSIWGSGYSTEMSISITRAKPVLSQTLSYITINRAIDRRVLSLTKNYVQVNKNIQILFKSISRIAGLKNSKVYKKIAVEIKSYFSNTRKTIKVLLDNIKVFSSLLYKNIFEMIISTSIIANSSIKRMIKTIKKNISSTISVIVFKINNYYKVLITNINTVSNFIRSFIFVKILQGTINTFTTLKNNFTSIIIDLVLNLVKQRDIVFNLQHDKDIDLEVLQNDNIIINAKSEKNVILDLQEQAPVVFNITNESQYIIYDTNINKFIKQ